MAERCPERLTQPLPAAGPGQAKPGTGAQGHRGAVPGVLTHGQGWGRKAFVELISKPKVSEGQEQEAGVKKYGRSTDMTGSEVISGIVSGDCV